MKIRMFILSLVAIAGAMAAVAQSSDAVLRDKMTNAVMKVYDEHLAQNPNDYNILFARAHQHYYNGDYTAALADVNQAMMLTPKTDKELRFDEYILRARISDARKDYVGELADLRLAQELEPKSLACTDLIAKANLKAGNLDAAEKAFKTILRAESINYDAMYGLALVEQARGNNKAAIEHATKAVELFKIEPQVYVNRADIFKRQDNVDAAVQDLVSGMAVGDGGKAAQELFALSDTKYDAVMNALDQMAGKSNDSGAGGVLRYLRANVALDHSRYDQALRELNYIRNNNMYTGATVDYGIAKCYTELGRYDEALPYANKAIQSDPMQPDYYFVKAIAEYYAGGGGHTDDAMETLRRCSVIAPQYVPMLLAKAALLIHQGNDNQALGYLNAAVANDPGNGEALFTRAMLFKRLNKQELADRDLNTMLLLDNDAYDLKGLAQSELGRDNDALGWVQQITSNVLPGGENYYYAALLMAFRGDNYKAMEYLNKAVEMGYASLHRLKNDVLAPVSLQSLRHEPGFDLLIDKAQPNFVEKL